jgi:hypothetical protein
MSQLFTLPFNPALSLQGDFMAACTLTFTLSGTTTAASVYADASLSTSLGSVVAADAYGRFSSIYLDDSIAYRVVLKNAQGVQIGTEVDPYGMNYGADSGASRIGTASGDNVQEVLNQKANLDSPTFFNLPLAPTATTGTSTNQIATTAFVMNAIEPAITPAIGFSGLKVATLSASSYASTITANAVSVVNSSGVGKVLTAVSVTPSLLVSGANGLDAGAVAASTWYHAYVIYNPTTSATAGLFSLSATSPTLPTGYTYSARVGSVRTQAASPYYLLPTLQYGRRAQYVVTTGSAVTSAPAMASGVAGSTSTPTWVAVAVAAFVPPTASAITVFANVGVASDNSQVIVAPNNSYGGFNSTTNPPPMSYTTGSSISGSAGGYLLLESTNIYWANNFSDLSLRCLGWEDNL